MSNADKIKALDALLPQTQCTECGYPDCLSYATALVTKSANTNLCVPGGRDTTLALAKALNKPSPTPLPKTPLPKRAVIDPTACIGCTKCLPACPVDAISGASKQLHTIINSECTGCGLCLPPCPTDCITLVPNDHAPLVNDKVKNKRRQQYTDKKIREIKRTKEKEKKRDQKDKVLTLAEKKEAIFAAIARNNAKKENTNYVQ